MLLFVFTGPPLRTVLRRYIWQLLCQSTEVGTERDLSVSYGWIKFRSLVSCPPQRTTGRGRGQNRGQLEHVAQDAEDSSQHADHVGYEIRILANLPTMFPGFPGL